MTGCIGIPPHSSSRPGLLWGYAASVQRVAKLQASEEFRGNTSVLTVSSLLHEGLQGIRDTVGSGPTFRHRAQQHRERPANTHSFLVQFALARRAIRAGADSWWPFYEEMCHRQTALRRAFDRALPKAERTALRMFLVELEDWLVPEVLRQVQE